MEIIHYLDEKTFHAFHGPTYENIYVRTLWSHSGKMERQDETQFMTKIAGRISFGSQLLRFVKFWLHV
jgi:hypothetical protein